VVLLFYIYEGGDRCIFTPADHQGQFITNVQNNRQICVEV